MSSRDIQGAMSADDARTHPARRVPQWSQRRSRWRMYGAICAVLLGVAVSFSACSTQSLPRSSQIGAGGSVPTVAVPAAATDLQQTVINVIHVVQPSVVEVQSIGGQGEAIGSGEVISSDGYIVTNDHVVRGFDTFSVVLSNGKSLKAQLVGEAAGDDLAVLKVSQSGMPPINFADSSNVQVGQFVLAIGTPLGLAQSATFGIVSALDRTATEAPQGPAGTLIGLIQTSAPINPGNSGGALVDLTGKLIGIPTLAATDPNVGSAANGIGFAIPSNRVKYIADQLVKSGHVTSTGQGFLGISGQTVTPDLASAYNLSADHGFLITAFVPDASGHSPAQQAGLQQGDIIVAVNGNPVNDQGDLSGQLLSLSPSTRVSITVQRGSSQQTVSVTLGERPAS
jgi:S1-C subfamily serine protease